MTEGEAHIRAGRVMEHMRSHSSDVHRVLIRRALLAAYADGVASVPKPDWWSQLIGMTAGIVIAVVAYLWMVRSGWLFPGESPALVISCTVALWVGGFSMWHGLRATYLLDKHFPKVDETRQGF